MKKLAVIGVLGLGLLPLEAYPDGVVIANIESPEFTEIKSENDGSWHVLADVAQPSMPLEASWVKGSRTELRIEISNQTYVISRADVELADERIVTSACDTVPLTLPNDSTSVSVKGAGESCD